MKTVWKYPIPMGNFTLEMPKDAKVLAVQVQGRSPMLWALVDPAAPNETRFFRVIGTGHTIEDSPDLESCGTFQVEGGMFVFHVFETRR